MKKQIILIAAATIALAACTSENLCDTTIENTITKSLIVEDGIWNDTKAAYVQGTGVTLTGNEKITVYGNAYEEGKTLYNTGVFSATEATPGASGYTFSHPPVADASGYNYFFLLPHKSSNQRGGSPQVPQLRLFPVQYPAADSFDPYCDMLIGKPAVNVSKTSTVEVNQWMRIGALVKMTIKDESNLLEGDPISIASLYFPGAKAPLAAQMTVRNAENSADVQLVRASTTYCYGLSAIYPDGSAKSGNSYNTWYVSLPVDFDPSQQVDLTVSTTRKTLKFKTTLASALSFKQNKLNGLTFALTPAKQIDTTETSIVTCFTNLSGSLANNIASTDGTVRTWSFGSCNLKTNEADGRSYLRTTSGAAESSITLPVIPDKYYTSVRVYPADNLYASASVVTKISLRSNGIEIQSKDMGYYTRDLSEKGYVEFTGITESQDNLSLVVLYSDGSKHENIIGTIAANYTDKGSSVTPPVVSGEVDYLEKYNNGEDIQIADLTVNKATYGAPLVIAPSALTYSVLSAGGVVIIDDKTGASITPDSVTSGQKTIANGSNDLILIGRWGNIGKQTEIKLPEWRVDKKDVAIFNVKLTALGTSAQMFAQTSGVTLTPSVRIADCFIDASANSSSSTNISLFLGTNTCTSSKGYGYFKNICLDNNIIKFTTVSGKNPQIFYHGVNNAGKYSTDQLYSLTNSVVYCESQMLGYVAYLTTSGGNFDNSHLEIVCENNTFYNLTTGSAYLVSYKLKGSSFANNVGYLNYSNYDGSKPYSAKIWLMYGDSVAGTFNVSDNKLYRENNPGNGVWVINHPSSKTGFTGSNNSVIDGNPFKSVDTAKGYLPLVDALDGYGASYTNKGYITKE